MPSGESISSTVESHDTSTPLNKEIVFDESNDHLGESSKKTTLGNDDQELCHAGAVERKHCKS